jgi:hypothetical protein
MKPTNNSEHVESFYSGIICALLVVLDTYDEKTLACEILKGCDTVTIRRIAKREGDLSIVELIDEYRASNRR